MLQFSCNSVFKMQDTVSASRKNLFAIFLTTLHADGFVKYLFRGMLNHFFKHCRWSSVTRLYYLFQLDKFNAVTTPSAKYIDCSRNVTLSRAELAGHSPCSAFTFQFQYDFWDLEWEVLHWIMARSEEELIKPFVIEK